MKLAIAGRLELERQERADARAHVTALRFIGSQLKRIADVVERGPKVQVLASARGVAGPPIPE